MGKITFIIILHNHQPVGNFDWVFNDAAHDAYLPFLEVLNGPAQQTHDRPPLAVGL